MATIFEMTGDDREKRIAELKQKMQKSAKRTEEEADAEQSTDGASDAVAEAAPEATAVADEAAVRTASNETQANEAEANEAQANEAEESTPVVEPTTPTAESSPVPAVAAPVATTTSEAETEAADSQAALTRREFLTYAWGAALGLLTVETALVSYFFMYPRFRAGEFGGKFILAPTDVPATDAPPVPEVAGKFWLVNTDEGAKALYMVCTHLGCLYKWQASNNRFECPCHGSKFNKAGFYIEGPAPRSLDTFELAEEDGQVVVDTGAKTTGAPASESPARIVAT